MIIMALIPRMTRTSMSFAMDMEFSTGPTEPIMRGSGTLIRLKDKELSGMLKAMFIGENSKTIWPMAMESTLISTEASIRESSKMMSKRATEKKSGSMELNTWVLTRME